MLKNKIKEIIDWCDQNDITIFYGYVDDESSNSKVYWDNDVENGQLKFLETAKKLNVSLIILNEIKNTWDSDNEEITQLKDYLDEDELNDLNEKLKKLKPFKGETVYFDITFIKDNTFFEFSERAKWADDFDDLGDFIEEHEPEDDDYEDEDENVEREKRLTKTEIKALSRQLADNEEFQECKNGTQRKFIASKVFEEKYDDKWVLNDIIATATSIVQLEINPKKKKELKTKIKELSKQGLSEDEIADRVGLSKGQLRRV